MGLLENKVGVVFGVANKRSIAWAIAQAWQKEGAKKFSPESLQMLKITPSRDLVDSEEASLYDLHFKSNIISHTTSVSCMDSGMNLFLDLF